MSLNQSINHLTLYLDICLSNKHPNRSQKNTMRNGMCQLRVGLFKGKY